jgi:hypothetical protein
MASAPISQGTLVAKKISCRIPQRFPPDHAEKIRLGSHALPQGRPQIYLTSWTIPQFANPGVISKRHGDDTKIPNNAPSPSSATEARNSNPECRIVRRSQENFVHVAEFIFISPTWTGSAKGWVE